MIPVLAGLGLALSAVVAVSCAAYYLYRRDSSIARRLRDVSKSVNELEQAQADREGWRYLGEYQGALSERLDEIAEELQP